MADLECIHPHRNRWRVQKRVGGRLRRWSFDSLEEAVAFRDELFDRERAVQSLKAPAHLTIGDAVRAWWDGADDAPGDLRRGHRERVRPRTQGDYQYLIDGPISKIAAEPIRLWAERPDLLKAWYDSFTTPVQVWRVHAILRQVFEYAMVRGWIAQNPASLKSYKPRRVKRRRKAKLVPSCEHVELLIAAAREDDHLWGFFVYTLATLGLRCGEACALHWENLDFATNEVDVEWSVCTPKTGYREFGSMFLKEPKAGEGRTLPVGADFFLRAGSLRHERGLIFPNPKFRGLVVPATPSYGLCPPGLWHPNEATRRFRVLRRKLGLPAYTPHSLRHFVATQALIKMQGKSLNQVAEFLGHSPRMTLELYGWTLDRDALRQVGETVVALVDVNGFWKPTEVDALTLGDLEVE